MKKSWAILIIIGLMLVACGGQSEAPTPTSTSSPTPAAVEPLLLPTERGEYFAASGVCTSCHKDMVDANGQDVSIDSYWRGTMMANATRDPYWQASVRAEVIQHPEYSDIIQDKCTTCHAPMARTTRVFAGDSGVLLDDGFLNPENALHTLAMDGISCTACHQIDSAGLGEESSFNGGFAIDVSLPVGERASFGPSKVTSEDATLMKSASGYDPIVGKHIQTAEFCGSCHTLYTPTIDNHGEIAGLFPEQMPYIEWLASEYSDNQPCQDCHMPEAQGKVVLSITNSPGRGQFSQHSFAGGNTYALDLLLAYGEEMGVPASSDQIAAARERAKDQLQEETANISIRNTDFVDSQLVVDLQIESQVGHKFPSGFPSRRVWVHFYVKDATGNIIFESGNWAENGEIYGNENDLDPAAYEPHYQVIEQPDQVQIYETIIGDVDNNVTTTLLRGSKYLKDNRLIPKGFAKEEVDDDISVCGNALSDLDFQGGVDVIRYQVDLEDSPGPFTVSAEILYQSIGYRWAKNLDGFDSPETQKFTAYYQDLPNIPLVVSTTSIELER